MIEDDATVSEMRGVPRPKPPKRSFMTQEELRLLRLTVIKVAQGKLAEQLLKPEDGLPVKQSRISDWETGVRPIPLWAARRIRELAEAAKRYDFKRGA